MDMENFPNEQLTEEPKLQASPEATTEAPVAGEEVKAEVEESQAIEEVVSVETTAPQEEPEEKVSDDDIELPEISEEDEVKKISIPETNEGIIERLNTLAENAEQSEKAELDLLKQVFYKRIKEEKAQAQADFVQNGGNEEEFKAEVSPLEEEFKKVMAIIKEQRNKLQQAVEKQKELNLEKKKIIIERIKQFLTSPEDANKGFDTVRTLQAEWKEIKPIPATAANEIWKSYQVVIEQFYDLLKTNNALRDYDYKKNLEAKTKLCETAEALAEETDIIRAARTLQELHQEFREIGPVAKELREELWNRFKTASSAVNKRHAQYFEQIKEVEEQNLAKKTEICEKIEAIVTDNLKNFSSWDEISKQIIDLQAEWKTIGRATKKMNNKIYERFRAACDNFFNKKTDFFKEQRKMFADNVAKKTELCEKAEALKESTEWNKTTEALIELQQAWKEIGPMSHKSSTALWERFNTACNEFFAKKKETLGGQRKEEQENLAKKNTIIETLKTLAEEGGDAVAEKLKELQAEWNAVGHVPFKSKDKVYEAYKDIVDEIYKKFNLRQRRQGNNAPRADKPAAEGNNLFRLYEIKKSELNTYETNFSFLSANSKKGNALIDSMQKKIDELKKEVAEIKQRIIEEQKKAIEEETSSEE